MDKITELLTRGVDTIYPTREALEKVLRSGKKLTLYQGFDPTGDKLHIGHMVGFRKLRAWQDLGHHVIFLIGDGTGQAGDPSGKTKARDRFLTREELRQNAKDYVMQAEKIVRFSGENPVEIRYNGDWLNKLSLVDILEIAGHFTLQQLIERDLFQERLKNNEPVNLREFLYPLLQGYDSVAMKVDLEIGGSDQTFNMLAGRQLVKDYLNKEKFVMTTPLLADSAGRKIGKTEGNVIALVDSPSDLYGKIMALGDDVIAKGFEYLTDVPMEEVQSIAEKIKETDNPMQYKKQLAFEIVKQLHSENDAKNAQETFEKTVQKGEYPSEITTLSVGADNEFMDEDFLVDFNLASSKSDAKRLFQQGGIEIDGKKITEGDRTPLKNNMILRVGKRGIVRISMK
ncbi:MAG: tyrosine--tRNA ligase [Candidatus Levybacteria bacterium]|nr:tyrosine--tRNA ligase [Candidatus Levybacteria bacterium]